MASRTLRRGIVVALAAIFSTSCTVQPSADIAAAPGVHADRDNVVSATPAARDVTRLSVHSLARLSGPANADGSLGSGCAAEESTTLPDGSWFAYIGGADAKAHTITADAACVFGVDSDQWQAYAAGLEEGEAAQGAVVSNDVSLDVDIAVDPDVRLYLESHDWEPVTSAQVGSEGPATVSDHQRAGMWLVVADGVVTAVVQPDFGGDHE
ncbi:hypothetical protein [Demequina globuliformis]|uniref:hypothetical protein n=1 Tax=Demequina globuliformis TaxID=676202 RepID=UPI000780FF53|nr:hypothetical protein [Demequina globuliformis]